MNRGLYTAATGMNACQRMLDVTANNLANVNTNAFKADGLVFKDALEASVASGGQISLGVSTAGQFTDFSVGTISQTGNPLDVAIDGEKGAFKVQVGQEFRYTRDGAFKLNSDHELVTKDGHEVLDTSDNPITLEGQDIQIDEKGQISVDGRQVATLGIYQGSFAKQGENLYVSSDAEAVQDARVKPHSIEGSNVNAVEAMVQMITAGRAFEMAQKAVTQNDELTQRLIQSLQ